MYERYMSLMRREIERTVQKLVKRPRLGLVESYDPDKHAVKVRMQPEGTLTGWIPLTAMAIGNQFGVLYAPNVKDQVELHFEGGDQMSARVVTRHFSKVDKAPKIEAGEYVQIHSTGSQIRQSKDGTVRIAGAGDVDVGQSGGGRSGNTGTGGEGNSAGDNSPPAQQQQQQQQKAKNSIVLTPDGKITITAESDDVTIEAKAKNVNLHADAGHIYCITDGGKTYAVSSKDASTQPVKLADGSPAKTLYAEPQ